MIEKSETKVRSEDVLGKKLDRCFADTVLKLGGGVSVGIILSLVIFKRRTWPIWFGAGLGIGFGASNCQHDLQNQYLLHGKKVKVSELPQGESTPKSDYVLIADTGAQQQKR